MVALNVGVLALQGAFARHVEMVQRLGVAATEVRTPDELALVDRLIMPGGESTTISMMIDGNGLRDALAERLAEGMPVFGTCAGMILLASSVLDGRPDQRVFSTVDMAVRRNAYGRQLASFEADLTIDQLGAVPFPGIFIRAPVVESIGPEVEVLATVGGRPVLCRQGAALVASFHPELSDDTRLHRYFCHMNADGSTDASDDRLRTPR